MKNRIDIVTDEISRELPVVRRFLDEHALDAVELRVVGEGRVPDLSRRDRETLEDWADAGDPAILAVSPGLFKCRRDDREEIARQLDSVLPRSIDLGHRLRARFLVVFAFENPAGAAPDEEALDALRAAAEAGAEAGLMVLVENEPGTLAGPARKVGALLYAADHPNLFANWDPLNGNEFGREELERGLRAIFPRVRHVHVKNGRLPPGELFARCGPLAEGAIDWPAHLRLLRELGYSGHLGIETHYEPVLEGSAVVLGELRTMLERIEGA